MKYLNDRFPPLFLITILIGSTLSITFAYQYISPGVAVKSLYTSAAVILSFLIYYLAKREFHPLSAFQYINLKNSYNIKMFLIIYMMTVSYIALSPVNWAVITALVSILIAITLVRVRRTTDEIALLQICSVFFLSGVTKIINTGFYFGYFDTLRHVRLIDEITQKGYLVVGNDIVSEYYHYPVTHLVSVIIRLYSSLPSYESLMLLGLLTFTITIVLTKGIVQRVTKNAELSTFVGFGLTLTPAYHFYSLFPFPQSIAFAISIMLIFFLISNRGKLSFNICIYIIGTTLLLTHHLIFIILALVAGLLILNTFIINYRENTNMYTPGHLWVPVVPIFMSVVSYWVLIDRIFIRKFVWQSSAIFNSDLAGGVYTQQSTYILGNGSYNTLSEAITWITGVWGIHSAAILTLFSIGIISIYELKFSRPVAIKSIGSVGIFTAALLLDTPITFKGSGRVSMVLIPLFAFIIGCGIYYILKMDRLTVGCAVGIIIIVTAGALAPAVTPGNYYELKEYNIQSKYSAQEYQEIREISEFAEKNQAQVTSLQIYKGGLSRFGVETSRPKSVSNNQIEFSNGSFLYSYYSTNYVVYHQNRYLYLDKILTTDEWLNSTVEENSKIYSTGEMGLINNRKIEESKS